MKKSTRNFRSVLNFFLNALLSAITIMNLKLSSDIIFLVECLEREKRNRYDNHFFLLKIVFLL